MCYGVSLKKRNPFFSHIKTDGIIYKCGNIFLNGIILILLKPHIFLYKY